MSNGSANLVLMVSLATLVITAVTSCGPDAGGDDTGTGVRTGAKSGPTFEFFDGGMFLAPGRWAGTTAPAGETINSALLGSLQISEVVAKWRRSGNFEDGVLAHPEFDPTMDFLQDIDVLTQLGQGYEVKLEWEGGWREGYLDYLVLADDQRLLAMDLIEYFHAMRIAAQEGALPQRFIENELAENLLNIGYAIYKSDGNVNSEEARTSILRATWGTAFALERYRAQQEGNEAQAAMWSRRFDELLQAWQHLWRERRTHLGG